MADGKPRCRLYLQVPPPLTARREAQLAHILEDVPVGCVLLCNNGQPTDEIYVDRLIDRVQAAGVACLVENDIALAERLGSDGVHIAADTELYTRARDLLGESANIGVGCGASSRHDAMRLAEMGADYVAFSPDNPDIDGIDPYAGLIAWWAEIFVVPCVAWNIDSAEHAARLAGLGADFIAPPRTTWLNENASTILADIDKAISHVRRAA